MAEKDTKKFIRFDQLGTRSHLALVNPEEDAFEKNPIPQPGWKQVKLGWQGNDSGDIQEVYDKETKAFSGYRLYLTATILKGSDKDAIYSVWLSTVSRRGKDTNEIATILAKLKVIKKSGKIKHETLVQVFGERINKGLILFNEIDWRGSRKLADGSYEDVFRSKHDFEKDRKTGLYKESCTITRAGESVTVNAQVQSRGWSVTEPELDTDDADIDNDEELLEEDGEVEETEEVETVKKKKKAKEEAEPVVVKKKKKAVKEEEEEIDEVEDEEDDDGDEILDD